MKCVFAYRDHRDQRKESMLMFLFLFREDIRIKMFTKSIEALSTGKPSLSDIKSLTGTLSILILFFLASISFALFCYNNQKMSPITLKPSAKNLTQGAERSHFRK